MPSTTQIATLKNKFYIKKDDTLPALGVQLIDRGCLGNRVPFDLSGATGCTFTMVSKEGYVVVPEGIAYVTSYTGGTIQYNWQPGDTSESGVFYGTFQLFFSTGDKMSVPQIGNITILIGKDINPFDI